MADQFELNPEDRMRFEDITTGYKHEPDIAALIASGADISFEDRIQNQRELMNRTPGVDLSTLPHGSNIIITTYEDATGEQMQYDLTLLSWWPNQKGIVQGHSVLSFENFSPPTHPTAHVIIHGPVAPLNSQALPSDPKFYGQIRDGYGLSMTRVTSPGVTALFYDIDRDKGRDPSIIERSIQQLQVPSLYTPPVAKVSLRSRDGIVAELPWQHPRALES
jgi:hypothetical protein